MKKIWNILCSIRTTFWLMTILSFFLLFGYIYTNTFFKFYTTLDNSPILQWLPKAIIHDFYRSWWIIGLCIIIPCIICNMFFCTIDKLILIIKNNHTLSNRQLMGKYIIAIVHLMSIVILISHFISLQFSTMFIFTINKEKFIQFYSEKMYLKTVLIQYYPFNSTLKNIIKDISITLLPGSNSKREIVLSALNPALYRGHLFFLIPNKKNKQRIVDISNSKMNSEIISQYSILVKKDYGYTLWMYSFSFIIVFILIFYFSNLKKHNYN